MNKKYHNNFRKEILKDSVTFAEIRKENATSVCLCI